MEGWGIWGAALPQRDSSLALPWSLVGAGNLQWGWREQSPILGTSLGHTLSIQAIAALGFSAGSKEHSVSFIWIEMYHLQPIFTE